MNLREIFCIMMKSEKTSDNFRLTRILYIVEAALEYFVAIATGTVYLAKIAAYCGISDEVTAILTAFVSLGCSFQLLSVFFGNRNSVKGYVSGGHIISQLLFTALYIIPLINFSDNIKAVVLIIALLAAQIIHNLVNAPKINWFMSTVKDESRGRFTAVKEIVSLIGGTAFSFGLSFVIDKYESAGNMRAAFTVGAVILGLLTVFHTLTLVFSKEPKRQTAPVRQKGQVGKLFRNRTLLKLVLVTTLFMIANYATVSFSGTYMNGELGFSLTFSSAVVFIGSICRVVFSVPFGKFADKKGFCSMLLVCFGIAALSYALNVFTVPFNGKILYPVYYSLHCIAMAGINSAMINLIYDYVTPEERTGALALNQSISGIAGFLSTLALSPVMRLIKQNGNAVFGIPVYAQQLFSLISFAIIVILIVYLLLVIRKLPRADKEK